MKLALMVIKTLVIARLSIITTAIFTLITMVITVATIIMKLITITTVAATRVDYFTLTQLSTAAEQVTKKQLHFVMTLKLIKLVITIQDSKSMQFDLQV